MRSFSSLYNETLIQLSAHIGRHKGRNIPLLLDGENLGVITPLLEAEDLLEQRVVDALAIPIPRSFSLTFKKSLMSESQKKAIALGAKRGLVEAYRQEIADLFVAEGARADTASELTARILTDRAAIIDFLNTRESVSFVPMT